MKFCTDCIHYELFYWEPRCHVPEAEVYKDMVYGYWPRCTEMRTPHHCGPDAKWFESKEGGV